MRPRLNPSDRRLLVRLLANRIEAELRGGIYGTYNEPIRWELIEQMYRIGLALGGEGKGRRGREDPAWLGFEVHQLKAKDPVKELRELADRIGTITTQPSKNQA